MRATGNNTSSRAHRGASRLCFRWLATVGLGCAILLGVALCGTQSGAAEPNEDAEVQLRAISYNVQFLPAIAAVANKRKEPQYRAQQLGEKLAAYDIVGLNEVFADAPREVILAGLRQAWGDEFDVVVSPKPDDGRFNGGLALATRLPILERNTMIYSVASSPREYGLAADGFASKGVVHARIARSQENHDDFVDVFITHMEARVAEIREQQYPEMAAFVKEHADGTRPVLLMGDFNTRGNIEYLNDPEAVYHRLFKTLADGVPEMELIDTWPAVHPGEEGGTSEQENPERGRRIDYIFMANPQTTGRSLIPVDVRVNHFLDERVGALSDHSAVEGDFRWGE